MAKQIISKDKLLESGVHYGHQTRSWNPAMKPFIAMQKRGIHLINLDRSAQSLENAYNVAKRISEKRGTFLFVGTTKQSGQTVRENAERVGAFYIDYRWLGGLITNFRTIQNSVNKLRRLERLEKENFAGYTKKEAILMKKELDKLQKALGGIKHMRRTPQAIFVTSIRNEEIAIKEAKKMGIPVFGIADTNVNPMDVNFPIFGNDDANKSVSLITTVIADAIAAGKNEKQLAAYVADDKIEVLGLTPESDRPNPRFQDRNNRPARTERPARAERPAREEVKVEAAAPVVEEVKIEETPVVVEEVKVEAPVVVEEVKVEEAAPVVEEAKTEEVVEEVVVEEAAVEATAEETTEEVDADEVEINEEEKEKTREQILKITVDSGISSVKLTDLFGVGPKTAQWLADRGISSVEALAEADAANFEEADLATLNLVKFKSADEKRERLTVFITEAKYIVSNAK